MSEAPPPEPNANVPASAAAPVSGLVLSPRERRLALLLIAVTLISALATGLLWQKLERIQEDLARRSADSGTTAIEARSEWMVKSLMSCPSRVILPAVGS